MILFFSILAGLVSAVGLVNFVLSQIEGEPPQKLIGPARPDVDSYSEILSRLELVVMESPALFTVSHGIFVSQELQVAFGRLGPVMCVWLSLPTQIKDLRSSSAVICVDALAGTPGSINHRTGDVADTAVRIRKLISTAGSAVISARQINHVDAVINSHGK